MPTKVDLKPFMEKSGQLFWIWYQSVSIREVLQIYLITWRGNLNNYSAVLCKLSRSSFNNQEAKGNVQHDAITILS